MPIEHNPDYIHHIKNGSNGTFREMIFGMEDGMVSTLGAITGIAAATENYFAVILSGLVIISVESISMAIGSYLSSKSVKDIEEKMLMEEKTELKKFPEEEKTELIDMYIIEGWPRDLANKMVEEASKNKKLFLQEMAYHELGIVSAKMENPLRNGVVMLFSYVFGGSIPLVAYFFLSINIAIIASIVFTLIGLFLLGVYAAKFSKRKWWKAGFEMFILASVAASIGFIVGQLVNKFL